MIHNYVIGSIKIKKKKKVWTKKYKSIVTDCQQSGAVVLNWQLLAIYQCLNQTEKQLVFSNQNINSFQKASELLDFRNILYMDSITQCVWSELLITVHIVYLHKNKDSSNLAWPVLVTKDQDILNCASSFVEMFYFKLSLASPQVLEIKYSFTNKIEGYRSTYSTIHLIAALCICTHC